MIDATIMAPDKNPIMSNTSKLYKIYILLSIWKDLEYVVVELNSFSESVSLRNWSVVLGIRLSLALVTDFPLQQQ